MAYHIKLNQFEGPLDLLLHLISKAKVQIEDISITEITQQYIDTLSALDQFDMDIASEFLVMAATLLHIKSCVLLPKAKLDLEEDEGIDPKQELITRLLEYKRYKEASQQLKTREAIYTSLYYKLPEEFLKESDDTDFLPGITSTELYQALIKLLSKKGLVERIPMVHQIIKDPVTITQRITQLKSWLDIHKETTFFKLFDQFEDRGDIVLTFLALLELMKDHYIVLYQAYPFEDIVIKRRMLHG